MCDAGYRTSFSTDIWCTMYAQRGYPTARNTLSNHHLLRPCFIQTFATIPSILRPISLLSRPSPLTVTPTILPTSLTLIQSGATSANNLTHLTASSLQIGFRNDICKFCTSVGKVKDTWAVFDLKISAIASSFACFFDETARLSRTGAISGNR